MRTIILICIFFMFSFSTDNIPETCHCSDGKTTWTAYCGSNWSCEKCCEKTKPKPKKKKKKKKDE